MTGVEMKRIMAVIQANVGNIPILMPNVCSGIEKEQRKLGFVGDEVYTHHCVMVYENENRDCDVAIEATPPSVKVSSWIDDYQPLMLEWSKALKTWRNGGWFGWRRNRPLIYYMWNAYLPDKIHDQMRDAAMHQIGKPYRMIGKYFGRRDKWRVEWENWGDDPVWHCSHFMAYQLQVGGRYDFQHSPFSIPFPGAITPAHNFRILMNGAVKGFHYGGKKVYALP
jgi:hypothetical protein